MWRFEARTMERMEEIQNNILEKITEFGEEKQDGKIFNTIYFKMAGKNRNIL